MLVAHDDAQPSAHMGSPAASRVLVTATHVRLLGLRPTHDALRRARLERGHCPTAAFASAKQGDARAQLAAYCSTAQACLEHIAQMPRVDAAAVPLPDLLLPAPAPAPPAAGHHLTESPKRSREEERDDGGLTIREFPFGRDRRHAAVDLWVARSR